MKRILKGILSLLLIISLFSCGSIVKVQEEKNKDSLVASGKQEVILTNNEEKQAPKLASDKQYTYDEINKKYKALHLKYSKNRKDFVSDEVFANFRNVKVGSIKEGILYRGASFIDNSYGRENMLIN